MWQQFSEYKWQNFGPFYVLRKHENSTLYKTLHSYPLIYGVENGEYLYALLLCKTTLLHSKIANFEAHVRCTSQHTQSLWWVHNFNYWYMLDSWPGAAGTHVWWMTPIRQVHLTSKSFIIPFHPAVYQSIHPLLFFIWNILLTHIWPIRIEFSGPTAW